MKEQNTNIVKMVGLACEGYGMNYKLIMTADSDILSIEAKAIYSYFASYCGGGESAFPSVSKILYDLGIAKNRYYKHIKCLLDLGLIEIHPRRRYNKKGKWVADSNLYILHPMVDASKLKPSKYSNNSSQSEISDSKNNSKNNSKNSKNSKSNDSQPIDNTGFSERPQNKDIQNNDNQNKGVINNNSINNNNINNNNMIDDDSRAVEVKRRIDFYQKNTEVGRVTPPVRNFIATTLVLSNELFDLLVEKAVVNSKDSKTAYSYFKKCVENCLKDNEYTLDAYKTQREGSDKDFRSKNKPTEKKDAPVKNSKTKAHNFNDNSSKYDNDDLMAILAKKGGLV